jgi:hypothetical protein
MDSRTNRAGSNSYGHIWILTLKRICAEGLQQIMHRKGCYGLPRLLAFGLYVCMRQK